MKPPDNISKTCKNACCGKCLREKSPSAGEAVVGSAESQSWLAQRPWIWFWVAFLVLIAVQTIFIVLATKYQPASVPLRIISNNG